MLTIAGVSKQWRRKQTPVLRDVSLAVPPGAVVHIGGANGAGKTTLLRIVAGLLEPDVGRASVAGLDPVRDRRAYQQRIGFLSATTAGLYARLTVAQHLDYWARVAFLPRSTREFSIEDALDRFGLRPIETRRVDRMSMGQRQRVRLAMAFLHEPDAVLLDEPDNSLDEDGRELLVGAVRELTSRGGVTLWCSPTGEDVGVEPDARYVIESAQLRRP